MHSRTTAILEALDRAVWFSTVGVRDTEAVTVLSSWEQAVESCSSQEWEDLCLENANRLRRQVRRHSVDDFERWNDLVDQIKPTTEALVERKIADVVREHHLPKTFSDDIRWQILHICMETEYSDIVPPAFYMDLALWYLKGHFPCGWEDEYPDGRLIVY